MASSVSGLRPRHDEVVHDGGQTAVHGRVRFTQEVRFSHKPDQIIADGDAHVSGVLDVESAYGDHSKVEVPAVEAIVHIVKNSAQLGKTPLLAATEHNLTELPLSSEAMRARIPRRIRGEDGDKVDEAELRAIDEEANELVATRRIARATSPARSKRSRRSSLASQSSRSVSPLSSTASMPASAYSAAYFSEEAGDGEHAGAVGPRSSSRKRRRTASVPVAGVHVHTRSPAEGTRRSTSESRWTVLSGLDGASEPGGAFFYDAELDSDRFEADEEEDVGVPPPPYPAGTSSPSSERSVGLLPPIPIHPHGRQRAGTRRDPAPLSMSLSLDAISATGSGSGSVRPRALRIGLGVGSEAFAWGGEHTPCSGEGEGHLSPRPPLSLSRLASVASVALSLSGPEDEDCVDAAVGGQKDAEETGGGAPTASEARDTAAGPDTRGGSGTGVGRVEEAEHVPDPLCAHMLHLQSLSRACVSDPVLFVLRLARVTMAQVGKGTVQVMQEGGGRTGAGSGSARGHTPSTSTVQLQPGALPLSVPLFGRLVALFGIARTGGLADALAVRYPSKAALAAAMPPLRVPALPCPPPPQLSMSNH